MYVKLEYRKHFLPSKLNIQAKLFYGKKKKNNKKT